MASVSGIVEQARAYLPEFVSRRRRAPRTSVRIEPSVVAPVLRQDSLSDLVAHQIIPRLVTAHVSESASIGQAIRQGAFSHDDLDAFAELAVAADSSALILHLEELLAGGVVLDSILVDLLAPTARRLGEMWDDDRCNFVDVTMGLWRLQEAVRELSARMPALQSAAFGAKHALFGTMPGEQHSFGTVIVEDVFQRDGWSTNALLACDTSELLDTLASSSFDLVGLTVSCDVNIARLPSLILAMRSVSRNPRLCVMIGGHALAGESDICTRVGADGTAPDAQRALAVASRLVATNACREVFCA